MPRIVHTDGEEYRIEEENSSADTPVAENENVVIPDSYSRERLRNVFISASNNREYRQHERPTRFSRSERFSYIPMDMFGSMRAEPRQQEEERTESLTEILDRAIQQSCSIPRRSTPNGWVVNGYTYNDEQENNYQEERQRAREEENRLARNRLREEEDRRRVELEERRVRYQEEQNRRRIVENTYNAVYNNDNPRTFGVEIEAYGMGRDELSRILNTNGIICTVEDYGHTTPRNWKLTTDSSITGDLTFELVFSYSFRQRRS